MIPAGSEVAGRASCAASVRASSSIASSLAAALKTALSPLTEGTSAAFLRGVRAGLSAAASGAVFFVALRLVSALPFAVLLVCFAPLEIEQLLLELLEPQCADFEFLCHFYINLHGKNPLFSRLQA